MESKGIIMLIEKFLRKQNLTTASAIREFPDYHTYFKSYESELNRRLKNGERLTVLSLFKHELINDYRGINNREKITQDEAFELNFRDKIWNDLNAGKYGSFTDYLSDIFGHYFYETLTKDEVEDLIPDIIKLISEANATFQFTRLINEMINAMPESNNEFKSTGNITQKQNVSYKDSTFKIQWVGSNVALARLFLYLIHHKFIENFQTQKQAPQAARSILSCFKITGNESDLEAQIASLAQYLKLSVSDEFKQSKITKEYGEISGFISPDSND